ncbi:MAG: protein kinase, partial [Planctomycetes bacterium]|nr:protein kinase [Planctomycetota bacterium]
MTLCSACRKDFSAPAGQTVPYPCPHCQTVVLGPYCGLEWIGGGGMGDVYRARDPQMGNRTVAIKIPLTEINPERAKQRFEREIAASALLQHENTVRAYQRGQEGGRPYLVMEYVSGRKLSDVVREEHPLSARRVGRIILGVAEALAHAEQKGVVNRDVKPGNVILAETNETPKVLDYGLALILGFEDEVTRSGSQLGTPSFMAPEQVRDPHSVAISADVYSLACTAFYCLAGRAPFQAPTTSDLYSLHAEAARPRIRQVRPDVAEEFDELIRWMMTADPRQRPTPRQVVETLEPLVAELSDRPPLPEPKADEGLIDVTCQSCDTLYHLSRDWVGKRFRCSNRLCGEVLTIELPEGIPTASPAELTGGSIDLSELPEAEIVEAEPVGAAEAAEDDEEESRETIDGGTPPMIVETAIADEADSHSDVEMLPSEAVVPAEAYDGSFDRQSASPGVLPAQPVESKPAEAEMPPEAELPPGTRKRSIVPFGRRKGRRAQTPKPPRKQKTARERRATNMKRAVGGLCAVLFIGSAITLWLSWDSLRPATPEERWATIMDDYVDHKWDRVVREMEEFEQEFPKDPHVSQIPFFRDLCDAGANIYSLTGDPEQGWESLKQIYMTHRDNPVYIDYSIDIYQGLVKVLEGLIKQAIETSDPAKLALVREVYELLKTVGRSREEPFVAKTIATLGPRIAQVEHRLASLQARDEVVRLLDPQQIADPSVNVDEIYAKVEVVLAKNPGLREDRDLMALLDDAYGAEPRRLHYLQEEPDAQAALPVTDPRDRTRQGYTLVVAWGNVDDGPLTPEADQTVFALARGILYAFDKRGGYVRWARRLGIDSHRLPIQVRPTATSPPSLIAVNSEDNQLLSLEPSTGEVLWRYRVGQHIVAPLSIVPRQTDPNAPITHYGLLPTTEGEIHVLELVLGKRLGVFDVGHPIT